MYDDFYKLKGKPFQLTPDHKFFFNSKGHNRAMAYLRYGIEQGEGFIVITGGIGTGKTTLVRNLFQELSTKNVMAAQLVTTQVDPDDMLRMVCASFGLAHEGLNKATLLHNLEAIARTRHAEGKQMLLVVDEAQNLPARSVEELRMLSNFQVGDRALIQSFLLGQEEFKRTLQSPGMEQFRQRIIASYHLEPLSVDETRKYIEHRLRLVGWDNDPEFGDGVIEQVYEFTGGVPRRINAMCDRLMLYGCLEELHRIDVAAVEVVQQELREEASHQAQPKLASVSNIRATGGGATLSQPVPPPRDGFSGTAPADTGQSAPPGGYAGGHGSLDETDLVYRLQVLERELSSLKQVMRREQKLLRKAILLQMDLDEFDDIE